MGALAEQVAHGILALLVCNTLFYFVIDWFFLRYLRRNYPDVWDSLDRPSLFWNNSIGNGIKTLRYIFSSHHQSAEDRRLSRMVMALRAMNVAQCVLLAIVIYLVMSYDI
jgi:hypothetical protein